MRLAGHVLFDLRLHLIELGRLAVALFLDLDDVPAELRLHRIGNLAGLERERDLGEFRHHLFLGEEAEIAAIGRARILRLLLGQLGEIGALVEFGLDRLGLFLGRHQDVAGVDFLLAGDLLGGVVIDLLHGLVGHRRLAFGRQQVVHQQAVTGEIELLLEIGLVGGLLLFGGLGDDLHVDQEGQHVFLLGRRVHLRQARPEFLFGQGHVALADFRAIHLGEHRVIVGANRRGDQQGHGKAARCCRQRKAGTQAQFGFAQ